MQQIDNLKHHLLIAMPQMHDSWFSGTVTYLCEHNAEGAMGVVLNKPLKIKFSDVCDQLEITRLPEVNPMVLSGGPVNQENGFILHRDKGDWGATLAVEDNIHLTSSKDILEAIAADRGPDSFRMGLGYAGWSAQQLDDEIKDNAWLIAEASPELLFDTRSDRLYPAALASLGVSDSIIGGDAGRA